MTNKIKIRLAGCFLLLFAATSMHVIPAQADSRLEFYSGYWVGAEFVDRPVIFSDPHSAGYHCLFTPQASAASVADLEIDCDSAGGVWSLSFASIGGAVLGVGQYPNAIRYPFQSAQEPGLNFSGHGRGCNSLNGEFEIKEIERDGDTLTKLAADFKQYCEGRDPPLVGAIRYNSLVPIAISDPTMPTPTPTGSPEDAAEICQTFSLIASGGLISYSVLRSGVVRDAHGAAIGHTIGAGTKQTLSVPGGKQGTVKYTVKNKGSPVTFQASQKKITAVLKRRYAFPMFITAAGELQGVLFLEPGKVRMLKFRAPKPKKGRKPKAKLTAPQIGTAPDGTCE